jgi:glycosyltransferase involved in cell wall biosynthesis
MSPRIAYWTSAFEPHMEAIAFEVAVLRRHFPDGIAWGLTTRHWARVSRQELSFHPRLHLVFRLLVRLLEPAFQLNHVFGSVGDWFYLQGVRRRPTVLTVAASAQPVQPSLLERVDRFVVEYPGGRDYLHSLGIAPEKVRLIFPPVDLVRFAYTPPPPDPFTVLFASSPDTESGLQDRGIPQLLDAAALRSQYRFRLLWRPWGDRGERVRQWIAERELRNVELVIGACGDMAQQYRQAHVTIAPFTTQATTKPVPNSLIESLASGRPVVATDLIGLSEVIERGSAGRICLPTGQGIVEQLDRLQREWHHYSTKARQLAEQHFGMNQFVEGYGRLYEEVLRTAARQPRGRHGRTSDALFYPPTATCSGSDALISSEQIVRETVYPDTIKQDGILCKNALIGQEC